MKKIVTSYPTVGSGSYLEEDVQFLLRPIQIETTDVEEKERLIQTGQRHYSEMITLEKAPSDEHMALFNKALDQNAARMAADVQTLAQGIVNQYPGRRLALVSFVRAGLPLGVLLRRAIIDLGGDADHYGISIIRDRGIDMVALELVIEEFGAENIIFVDGWTGKGAISGEIKRSLAGDHRFPANPRLVVLADPCGKAWMAASAEDWIIPSGILGATVSGLVSRSIWPHDDGMHGCIVYDHLAPYDVTKHFIETIELERQKLSIGETAAPWGRVQATSLQHRALQVVERIASEFDIDNLNRVKPGIAEATRAVMRRAPYKVMVKDLADPDVQLLLHLTVQAGIAVEAVGEMLGPYRAITIIKKAE